MTLLGIEWMNPGHPGTHVYQCGYCGQRVASVAGYYSNNGLGTIFVCPNCTGPTILLRSERDGPVTRVIPGSPAGGPVEHVPESVNDLYEEARRCLSVDAFTSSVLASRKLLMNLAVAHGADQGKTFAEYIEYLGNEGYVPPNGKAWLDRIRQTGNEATHEIVPKTHEDAEQLISFTEMLLKFMYEFPARAQPT